MSGPASVLTAEAGGLRLAIRLQPGASRARFGRPLRLGDGSWYLRAWITEAPEKGRANAALLKLLSKNLKLPRSAFSLVSGPQDRCKVVAIQGAADVLLPHLTGWIESLPDA